MDKPGLSRAIPYMIIAFILSLLLVYGIRTLQDMDPVWMNADSTEGAQVGLVLAAFASMAAFMWGIGAFDPKMSEHGDHAHEEDDSAPERDFALKTDGAVFRSGQRLWDLAWEIINDSPKPTRFPYLKLGFFLLNWIVNVVWIFVWAFGLWVGWRVLLVTVAGIPGTLGALLMTVSCLWQTIAFYAGQLFYVLTISVVLTILLFAFALFPHGLNLQTATEPNAGCIRQWLRRLHHTDSRDSGLGSAPGRFCQCSDRGRQSIYRFARIHLGHFRFTGGRCRRHGHLLLSGASRRADRARD